MNRQIVYPGQIPQDTDVLNTNKNIMLALGAAFAAIFGTNTLAYGLQVTPTAPATLTINVAPGSIYALTTVDANPYGSLPADTTDTIVKQGVLLSGTTETLVPPTTAGYSQVVLIEAAFSEVDGGLALLPFYNASNPQQPYSGPGGNNQQSTTVRQGLVSIQAKYGVAAPTGTQTAPAPDAGYIGLATVTLTNGQTQITSANIVAVSGAVLSRALLTAIQANALNYGVDVGAANACVVNLNPTPPALVDGMVLYYKVAATNTANATLNAFGTGALPIIGIAHAALQGNELVAGGRAMVIYNSTLASWILLDCTGGAQQVGNASASQQAATLGQVQSGASTYAVDGGAANAYVVALTPAITALTDGLKVRFRPAHTNTGASTLNVNGTGAEPIIGIALQALVGNEIVAGSDVEVTWNSSASSWVIASGYVSGLLLGVTAYRLNGTSTFTPNPRARMTIVRQCGAGGAGGGCQATSASQSAAGSGGNAGNYAEYIIFGPISGTVSVTIGAGGTAVSGNSGNIGGSTSFGTYCTTPGGNGGLVGGAVSTFPAVQGAPTSNTANSFSGVTVLVDSTGGLAFNGLTVGSGAGQAVGGRPGSNPLTGAGAGPGAGGNGAASPASTAAAGGFAGSVGTMIVEEWS